LQQENLGMKSPPLEDYSGDAAKFFGDSRTPASVVMGAAITAIFALPQFSTSQQRSKTELFLVKAYRILSWTAFVLSLHVFITCTITSANLLLGNAYNPMAESAHALLQREFEYQFLVVCWCTIVSMLSFIVIVTVRVMLEFDLWRIPARRDTALFMLCSSGALMASLLSFVNEDMNMNMKDMTLALIRLVVADVLQTPTVMDVLTVLFVIGSLYFSIKSAFFTDIHKTSLADTRSGKDKAP
jgi:hypothetical protein